MHTDTHRCLKTEANSIYVHGICVFLSDKQTEGTQNSHLLCIMFDSTQYTTAASILRVCVIDDSHLREF